MKLTTKGRYAVMAMVDLSLHGNHGGPVNLADIAARQEISLSYLEQLFARLRQAGLVQSVRGPGGGYRLCGVPGAVRIAEIISAVDEDLKATRCENPLTAGCLRGSKCLTHDLWDALGQQMAVYLSGVTLADVCAQTIPAPAPPARLPAPG